jgi:hypothetical protein
VLREPGDLLEDLAIDGRVLEPAHGPTLHHQLGELHD